MPIRFRCVYCEKLLGIATRKAGTIVNCPQCGEKLIVPTPPEGDVDVDLADEEPIREERRPPLPVVTAVQKSLAGPKPAPPRPSKQKVPAPIAEKLFDGDDLPSVLNETKAGAGPPATYGQRVQLPASAPPPHPIAAPTSPEEGIHLSRGMAVTLGIFALILMAGSFFAGVMSSKAFK